MSRVVGRAAAQDFWYWINERHLIYCRRAVGGPKPWTTDPIFQQYKFTNVFRQLDTGTRWLTEHFVTPHLRDHPHASPVLFFNIAWYRMFNWTGTGELLGFQTRWDPVRIKKTLHRAADAGTQIFTGAHIVRSEFGRSKIDSMVDICHTIYKNHRAAYEWIHAKATLQDAFTHLLTYPYIGPFLAYEITTDLRHTPILQHASDINTWANAGPGAIRGLERLYGPLKKDERLPAMRNLLEQSITQRRSHVPTLELRDIEHSLCEFDKYMRVKLGEGRPRSTYPGV